LQKGIACAPATGSRAMTSASRSDTALVRRIRRAERRGVAGVRDQLDSRTLPWLGGDITSQRPRAGFQYVVRDSASWRLTRGGGGTEAPSVTNRTEPFRRDCVSFLTWAEVCPAAVPTERARFCMSCGAELSVSCQAAGSRPARCSSAPGVRRRARRSPTAAARLARSPRPAARPSSPPHPRPGGGQAEEAPAWGPLAAEPSRGAAGSGAVRVSPATQRFAETGSGGEVVCRPGPPLPLPGGGPLRQRRLSTSATT
jgi:hypothetical protein